jgi:hypothetical protein
VTQRQWRDADADAPQMKVDYVRLYQLDGQPERLSCDP